MIEEYLSQKGIVERVLGIEEILKLASGRQEINIMMGQTFDSGQPLDMIKYALLMMDLGDMLSRKGADVSINWVIADHFMVDINKEKGNGEARQQAKERIDYLERLNDAYNGRIGIILSSELSRTCEYQENLGRLRHEKDLNPRFRELVLQAVPEDRRDNPDSIDYPLEELSAIQTVRADIKVGPGYEICYDKIAREVSSAVGFKKYAAVHLTKSFPFGNPSIPEKLREQVEDFGLLPYKKDSKGLGSYRIDPVNDSFGNIRNLIAETTDGRALADLLAITELARQRIEPPFFSYRFTDNLKDTAINSYREYIEKPMRGKRYE